jgi:hypothetical protein
MFEPARPYEPLTSENAALVLIGPPGRPHDWGSRHFNGRAEAQCGVVGQSGQSSEITDRRYHHSARQHVGAGLPGTAGGAPRRSDH